MSDTFVRPLAEHDASAVIDLLAALAPVRLESPESLVWRQSSEPARSRRGSWVAVDGDEVVGFATAHFDWWASESGKGRMWVGVRHDCRRRGIGSALWDAAVEHLRDAHTHTVEVDDDPDGLAFVERRGFTQYDAEVMSRVDPRETASEAQSVNGYRLVSLREVRGRERDLYEFYGAAGGIPPADPENRVTFEDWRRFILGNPLLEQDGSFVVLDDEDRVVSLAWLLVDRERRRAENEWTATLPQVRGQGLARLGKAATIRWAKENGIEEIVTGNGPHNLPMRELNRRLGYRELFVRRDLERQRREITAG